MNRIRLPGFVLAALLTFVPLGVRPAFADVPADATALSADLDAQIARLSTGDCVLACQSLGAMRKTADRICALDPGARCARAREKLQEVTRRVETSCPTCASAPGVAEAPPVSPDKRAPADAAEKPRPAAESAPPQPGTLTAEKRGGTCAACSIGQRAPTTAGAWALALGALLWIGRRRKRRSLR